MEEVVLEAKNLSKAFRPSGGDPVQAVRNVSFEVKGGEIFGFLGPNGAGKTTTIGMLTTQIRPDSGHAYVAGADVLKRPRRARRAFGAVTQHNNLDRSLTAWENLLFHGRYYGMDRQTIERQASHFLQEVGLTEDADRPVASFSGGMIQRLKIARALLHDPAVLFLDEPTTGLDPQARRALWETITGLRQRGAAILLTTHYMEEAESLCDRVAIIHEGENVTTDTVAELKSLIPASNVVELQVGGDRDGLAEALREEPDVEGVARDSRQLRIYTRERPDLSRLLDIVEESGMTVTAANYQAASLEDVFIHLTGRALQDI